MDHWEAAAVAILGDGLVTVDHHGVVLTSNPAAEAMSGYQHNGLIGRDVRTLVTEQDVTDIDGLVGSEAVIREAHLRRADGSTISVDLTITALSRQDHPVYVVAIHDITARKRMEDQTAAALRANQSANEQLSNLNDLKSEFVSIVSHEFRAGLTGIRAFSEMIRDKDLTDDEIREYAEDINADAKRISRMVSDLLDLDALESGRMVARYQSVDVDALIAGLVERHQHLTQRHRLVFHPGGLPVLSVDRDKIAQVIVNLLTNAMKYSPDGGEITVRTWVERDQARLAVTDQGVGIIGAELDRVFDRYHRVENRATKGISGTGLGLPIVRQIVRLHGGHVWAQSRPGAGSTFYVDLPLHPTAHPDGAT